MNANAKPHLTKCLGTSVQTVIGIERIGHVVDVVEVLLLYSLLGEETRKQVANHRAIVPIHNSGLERRKEAHSQLHDLLEIEEHCGDVL